MKIKKLEPVSKSSLDVMMTNYINHQIDTKGITGKHEELLLVRMRDAILDQIKEGENKK